MEAAKSLGMRYGLAMRRIVLPQAARVIVPPLGNEFNNMMKTTSLLVFRSASTSCSRTPSRATRASFNGEYFVVVAFWYLMLTTVWTFIQAWIERRLAESEHGEELTFRERLALAWNPVGTFTRMGKGEL